MGFVGPVSHLRCLPKTILLAPLPSLRWRCCPLCTGVAASIALASSPASADVNTLVALGSMPSICWCPCLRHIVSLVMLVLLPLLHPCCRQHRAGFFAGVPLALSLLLRWRLRHHFAGAVAVVVLPLLLHWRCCPRRTHVAASIVWALLPSLHWCCHHWRGASLGGAKTRK